MQLGTLKQASIRLTALFQVSRYQKAKTNLDFTEARDSEWQWHQLGHMQFCTSFQTDNHASTPPLKFVTGRMPFLPPNQQRQSTEGNSTEGSWAHRSYQKIIRSVNCLEIVVNFSLASLANKSVTDSVILM